MTNSTMTDLHTTATDIKNELNSAIYSHSYFKYILDATDEDIATTLQLEVTVTDLKAQLKAVQATIKIMNKAV